MKKLSYPLIRFILNSALVLLTAIPCFFLGRWILLSLFDDRPACPLCLYSHVVHDYYAATGISGILWELFRLRLWKCTVNRITSMRNTKGESYTAGDTTIEILQ